MRIVLSNYRYYLSGGPEKYLFSCKQLLEEKGMQVFPFSVKSIHNMYSEWENYFLSPLCKNESAYFHEYSNDLRTILKVLDRSFYSPEGFIRARNFAKHTAPDLIYSLHFLNKMSPSVLDGFKSMNIPVVVRLSDFALICPQGLLLKNDRNCEACIIDGLMNCLRNKCIQNSYFGSLIKLLAWKLHRIIGALSRIDAFVCPSLFTMKKYIEAGFPKNKLIHIPTFIDISSIKPDYSGGSYVLYFGRIAREKGVEVLLKAFDQLEKPKPKLLLIGSSGNSEYCQFLKEKYSHFSIFKDFMPQKELEQYVKNSSFVAVPSICYDNMPNVLLEAFANGKAVIASNTGGFPDFIVEYKNGLLFKTSDVESLAKKLSWAIKNPREIIQMGMNARKSAEINFSPDRHFKQLNKLFNSLTS